MNFRNPAAPEGTLRTAGYARVELARSALTRLKGLGGGPGRREAVFVDALEFLADSNPWKLRQILRLGLVVPSLRWAGFLSPADSRADQVVR